MISSASSAKLSSREAAPAREARPRPGLSEAQRRAYWRFNARLSALLLAIWFLAAFVLGGLLAGALNRMTVFGFPFGYYMAAQGSLVIFLVEIAVYARVMNRKDLEFGIHE